VNLLVHIILGFIALVSVTAIVVAAVDEWRGVL